MKKRQKQKHARPKDSAGEDDLVDAKELPDDPGMKQFENLAQDFVDAYNTGEAEALERFRAHFEIDRQLSMSELREHASYRLQRLRKLPRTGTPSPELALADARDIIADLHGFANWLALAEHMDAVNQENSPVSRFEAAVDAVITGDVKTLESLLREDPELIRARSTRKHGATLLHYVSANGVEDFRQKSPKNSVEVAKLLLAAGAAVDATMLGDSTTLGSAATSVHPFVAGVQMPLLETLIEAGAAVDGAPGGWNPLIAALHNGRGEAAEFLAQRGARLDLEAAAGVGRLDEVKSYFNEDGSLKANATRAQLEDGFAWACEYGRTSVVDFLLQHGIELDTVLKHNGQTGLHWAAYNAHADIVKLLLERRAAVNIKDQSFGGTPLGWALYGWSEPAPEAERDRYYEVVALLVAAGATVNPEWLADPDRELPIPEKVRSDPQMLAALKGELPID